MSIRTKRLLLLYILFIIICRAEAQTLYHSVNTVRMHLWADSIMQKMTPDERLGQLIMPIVDSKNDDAHRQIIRRDIEQYHVGGLLFSKGTIQQQAKMTRYGRSLAKKAPLWIALDGEWGLGMRLTDAIKYPRNGLLGTIDPEIRDSLMYRYGQEIARQCRAIGVNINFAPVIDINSNPQNPVIGNRSFGSKVWDVIPPALSYSKGLEDGGILAVAKHFPGHGDTDTDSHKTLPLLSHSKERMMSFECEPFRYFVKSGFGGIMVAHLEVPSLDSVSGLPSSLSEPIVTGILKEQFGFRGLVFTDGLAMKGVNAIPDYSVKALLAGIDILLDPVPLTTQWKSLKKAISEGTLPQSLIDEKCRKVLCWKYILCVGKTDHLDATDLVQYINTDEAYTLKDILNDEVEKAKLKKADDRKERNATDSLLPSTEEYDPTIQGLPPTARVLGNGIQTDVHQVDGLQSDGQIYNARFHRIDSLVQVGIDKEAFPGCQILVAHKGKIIYNRAFGWLDYDRSEPNSIHTVYDLASASKAAATLPAVMLVYDHYNLKFSDPICWHIPLLRNTDKKNITIRQVLLHESDIRDGGPFYALTLDSTSYEGKYYSTVPKHPYTIRQDKKCWFHEGLRFDTAWIVTRPDERHSVKIANDLYIKPEFRDSIVRIIKDLPLRPQHQYRYSDLNFILLRALVETLTGQRLDQYLYDMLPDFYGDGKLCYNPLDHGIPLSRIAPTENDLALRRQQIRGYVHDETAAWCGGVEGNSGLFGSASDLYPLLQMIMNGGTLNGKRYINEVTCQRVTTQKSRISRRGLGFDKPETNPRKINPCCKECSPQTYGHTGYTGTCFWIDPQEQLIFIFLSNRVNPHRWNTGLTDDNYRPRIQSLVYEAIK